MKSSCCNAKIWVAYGQYKLDPNDLPHSLSGKTCFYLCDECSKACDAVEGKEE